MPTLSACFLTRNEETTIDRAVRSAKAVADEVVVADTGSDDRTAALAAAAGATVVQFNWGDDFAAGRDFTIRRATGDWVLWMQANEELLPQSHAALRDCIGREDAFGFFVRVQNVTDPARPDVFSETSDLRLFRRRPDLPRLYVGRLHPHFHPDVVESVKRQGLAVVPCDVTIRSHVETSKPSTSKLRFNARLLEAELAERPDQLNYEIEYGRTLLLMDDARGHEVLAKAAAQMMAARHAPSPPSAKVQVLLNYLLTLPPERAPQGPTFDVARELALRWFPDSPNVLWTLAERAFHRKEYAGAAEHLRRLLHLGRTGGYDRTHRFDPNILGPDALLNLGACYLQLRRLDDAEACLAQLTGHAMFGPQAAKMIAMAQRWRTESRK